LENENNYRKEFRKNLSSSKPSNFFFKKIKNKIYFQLAGMYIILIVLNLKKLDFKNKKKYFFISKKSAGGVGHQ
jgi:hypothetical protein